MELLKTKNNNAKTLKMATNAWIKNNLPSDHLMNISKIIIHNTTNLKKISHTF